MSEDNGRIDFDLTNRNDGMSEFVAVMRGDEESICPACGNFISYCPGHGEIGDPVGYAILEMHETDNHTECNIRSECREDDRITWSEARIRFNEFLDERYGMISVAGRSGYSTSGILAKCDPIVYREIFNDWCDSEGLDIDDFIGPVDMPR